MGGFGTAREKQGDALDLGEGDPGAAAKTCGAPLLFFLPFGWFFVGGRVGDGEGSCGGRTVVLLVRGWEWTGLRRGMCGDVMYVTW